MVNDRDPRVSAQRRHRSSRWRPRTHGEVGHIRRGTVLLLPRVNCETAPNPPCEHDAPIARERRSPSAFPRHKNSCLWWLRFVTSRRRPRRATRLRRTRSWTLGMMPTRQAGQGSYLRAPFTAVGASRLLLGCFRSSQIALVLSVRLTAAVRKNRTFRDGGTMYQIDL